MNPLEKQCNALTRLFEVTGTRYAIVGGLAVLLYGEPRLTMDIDVNVALAAADIRSFLATAKKLGFLPACAAIESFVKKTGVLPMKFTKIRPAGRCDIILAQSSLEDAALNRARVKRLGTLKARFVTAEDLIIHKIASDRPRDTDDLQGIVVRQMEKLDQEYILFWLKKIDKANGVSLTASFKSLLRSVRQSVHRAS